MRLQPFTTAATARAVPFTSPRSGRHYTLTVSAAGVDRCSCPGFRVRGRCAHAIAAAAVLLQQRDPSLSREQALALVGGSS